MGYLSALDMANHTDLETALHWHLRANHYPPIPASMVSPCKRAILKARRGDYNSKVRLPDGISYRGKRLAPVHAVVEAHHLEAFLE